MNKFFLLLLITSLIQGLTACGQHKLNPEARKLNDSAVALITNPPVTSKSDPSVMAKINIQIKDTGVKHNTKPDNTIPHVIYTDNSPLYEKAIGLLNKAIQIDSNYFIAYLNKFNFETLLKKYKDALVAAKEMVRLGPNDSTVKFMAGKMYDETGDTVNAKIYYQDYLKFCDHKLDTMSAKNRNYKFIEEQKAFVLILLNQADKGHDILKKLYSKSDDWEKDFYTLDMRLTRTNMLEDKKLSITVGNNTTSINRTLFPEEGSGSQNIEAPASNKLNH